MAGVPIETLSRVPLFEELDEAELRSVAASMHEANIPIVKIEMFATRLPADA